MNNVQSAYNSVKSYSLEVFKTSQGSFCLQEFPLNPPGQEQREIVLPARTPDVEKQSFTLPKKTSQKAFSCGDVFEVSSYFDENMQPLTFWYDYSARKESAFTQEELTRLELIGEGWEVGALGHVILEPEPDEEPEEPKRELTPEEQARHRAKAMKRAKNNARRIIQHERFDMMWTLTFAPEPTTDEERVRNERDGIYRYLSEEEQRDRKAVNRAWNKCIGQLTRYCKRHHIELRWVKVLERHDSEETSDEKRYTYHIHLASKLRINKRQLQKIWGYGNIWFTDYRQESRTSTSGDRQDIEWGYQNDPSFYMCKYLDKDFDEAKDSHQKAFSTSQNVKTPGAIRDPESIKERKEHPVKAFTLEGMHPDVKRRLLLLTDIDAIKLDLPDSGYGSGVYKFEYERFDRETQQNITVKGFVKKEFYDARLVLPKYKARYEAYTRKRHVERLKRLVNETQLVLL